MATVFLDGATGFVGRAVLRELLRRGHRVRAITRSGTLPTVDERVLAVRGDLFDPASLDAAMKTCDAAVHLVGIIEEKPAEQVTFQRIHVEGTRNVVEAATRAGVRRLVHMSALGTRADAVAEYHRTKWQAEQFVRASSLEWTILRPSMIHGPDGEFIRMAADWARGRRLPFLFMPYFGVGATGLGAKRRIQPIHVDDVASAFAASLDRPATIGQTISLAGPDVLTWPQLHDAVSRAVTGKPGRAVPIPAWYASLLTRVTPASLLPFNRSQVQMAMDDNTADAGEIERSFAFAPRRFEASLNEYAAQLR
jgi:NADH dehydrogenase